LACARVGQEIEMRRCLMTMIVANQRDCQIKEIDFKVLENEEGKHIADAAESFSCTHVHPIRLLKL
jgi:hypothetical protein